MKHFKALVVSQDASGTPQAQVQLLAHSDLPAGEVLVAVEYSSLNYKDGLCLGNGGGLVRHYPHVPGIDFAGRVEASSDPRYKLGDAVILTGWRVGESHWGGYAQMARVKADWLVPLPAGLTTRQAMALGTAGFTAMLALIALEHQGLTPDQGPVLVTGAAGGVGSVSIALLVALGYEVCAVSGRPETYDYLTALGAQQIMARNELNTRSEKPLERETWAGCIDAVGGDMLARVLGQMRTRASVAAVGLAGGAQFSSTVIPFLLRGVNLLGIDSVLQPFEPRAAAWQRLAEQMPLTLLESIIQPATLHNLPELGQAILSGHVRGRVVVDVNAE